MDKDMPAEKRQMMIFGLGGATFLAVCLLVWMVVGQVQREEAVKNALPSKPIPGFERGGQAGNAPPSSGGALPGAPPTNSTLPGAPPMPR